MNNLVVKNQSKCLFVCLHKRSIRLPRMTLILKSTLGCIYMSKVTIVWNVGYALDLDPAPGPFPIIILRFHR